MRLHTKDYIPITYLSTYKLKCLSESILENKPCGLGSRIRDMEAESYN